MGLLDRLFESVDFTKWGAYAFFLGILVLLPYWYFHEGATVLRGFSRLFREIAKETSLQDVRTDAWRKRLASATSFFDLGLWFVTAWTLLLLLVFGLVFLHGAQADNVQRIFVISSDPTKLVAVKSILESRLPADQFQWCAFLNPEELCRTMRELSVSSTKVTHTGTYDTPADIRNEIEKDARELGLGLKPNVVLGISGNRADYVLVRQIEGVFCELIACKITEASLIEDDAEDVVSFINSAWRRRAAQRWIGSGYIAFCLLAILYVKRAKSFAFSEMLIFSTLAMDRAMKKRKIAT